MSDMFLPETVFMHFFLHIRTYVLLLILAHTHMLNTEIKHFSNLIYALFNFLVQFS